MQWQLSFKDLEVRLYFILFDYNFKKNIFNALFLFKRKLLVILQDNIFF